MTRLILVAALLALAGCVGGPYCTQEIDPETIEVTDLVCV